MPASIAWPFVLSASGLSSSRISPDVGRFMPNSDSANSVRPEPSSPVRPTISPARMSRLMSWYWPARDRWRTDSTVRDAARSAGRVWYENALPVISVASLRSSISFAGNSPTFAPSRSTVTRSAISMTSSSRCETKTMQMPARFRSATRRTNASTS